MNDITITDEMVERASAVFASWRPSRPTHREAMRAALEAALAQNITHGRHCTCGACEREDWTNPDLACCGMHGASCPRVYQPLGMAGELSPPVIDDPNA